MIGAGMDPTAFDVLARSFGAAASRRLLLRRLAALSFWGAPITLGAGGVLAQRPLDRVRRRTQQRHRKQRNTRSKHKDNAGNQNNDPGKGRPLDCPDEKVSCYLKDDPGGFFCNAFVHEFPTVGHCGHGLVCCPCGHTDQAYWTNKCNTEVEGCQPDKCVALDQGTLPCFGCV
jgi:hypothetical protein